MEISRKVIDIYDDLEFSGLKKIASAGLPENVRKMQMLDGDKLEQMCDEEFGLVCFDKYAHKLRRYPIHDKEHTWLSAQYFDKTASALTPSMRKTAAARIKDACHRHDIKNYPESLDGVEKIAERKGHYALRNEYPINNPTQVRLAAGFFSKYASQIADPKDRNTFASNVVSRAENLGVEIQEDHKDALSKYASDNYSEAVFYHIQKRAEVIKYKEEAVRAVKILEKLASSKDSMSPQEFADSLYKFDKYAGINKYWDSSIKNPYESVMGIEKKASATLDVRDGDMTEADLKEVLNSNKLDSYLGKTMVSALKKNPLAIFESLPKPHKEIIYNIAKKRM